MAQNFFNSHLSGDAEYEMLRNPSDESSQKCKDYVESLWKVFEPYADKHFLSDCRNHFHQRFWEMYLCVSLISRGFRIALSFIELLTQLHPGMLSGCISFCAVNFRLRNLNNSN